MRVLKEFIYNMIKGDLTKRNILKKFKNLTSFALQLKKNGYFDYLVQLKPFCWWYSHEIAGEQKFAILHLSQYLGNKMNFLGVVLMRLKNCSTTTTNKQLFWVFLLKCFFTLRLVSKKYYPS